MITGNPAITGLYDQIAPEFSTSQSYTKGQMVIKDGKMYIFTRDHPAGAWNASHVSSTTVTTEIELLPDKIISYVGEKGYSRTFTQFDDPADDPSNMVVAGDYWVKTDQNFATVWEDPNNSTTTWNDFKNQTWGEIISSAAQMYCRKGNGADGVWVPVNDTEMVSEAYTRIEQTRDQIASEAKRANAAEGELSSKIVQTASEIMQVVGSSYIGQTSVYQTADAIVSAAETYTNGKLNSYSTTTQTATMISQYVTDNAYQIQSGIEIKASGVEISGGKYIKIKSGGTFTVDSGNFSVDSNGNVTMKGRVEATSGEIAGWKISTNNIYRVTTEEGSGARTEYSGMGSDIYSFFAGATTNSSGTLDRSTSAFWVKKDGSMKATLGKVGGWDIGTNYIGNANTRNDSTVGMAIVSSDSSKAFWAGGNFNGTGDAAPKFYVTRGGELHATGAKITGTITGSTITGGSINIANSAFSVDSNGYVYLRGLMVKGVGSDPESFYPIDFSGAFSSAVSYTKGSGSWSGTTYKATLSIFGKKTSRSISVEASVDVSTVTVTTGEWSQDEGNWTGSGTATLYLFANGVRSILYNGITVHNINATPAYNQGITKGDAAGYTRGTNEARAYWRPDSISENVGGKTISINNASGDTISGPYSVASTWYNGYDTANNEYTHWGSGELFMYNSVLGRYISQGNHNWFYK